MAHAPSLTRSERASGIVERHETLMRDDGTWQVRDTAGSGKWHTVVDGHCTCPDYVFRHMTCKHLRAVAAEERELAAFCTDWNARSEQRRAALEHMPGDFLSTGLNFDDDGLLGESLHIVQTSPRCPMCSAPLVTEQFYIGGRGYVGFEVCSGDGSHSARRLS